MTNEDESFMKKPVQIMRLMIQNIKKKKVLIVAKNQKKKSMIHSSSTKLVPKFHFRIDHTPVLKKF